MSQKTNLAWSNPTSSHCILSQRKTIKNFYSPRSPPISFSFMPPKAAKPLVTFKDRFICTDKKAQQAMRPNKFDYVSFRDGKWKQLKMGQICENIRQWSIECGLFVCGNHEAQIYKSILHIWFPNLTKLDLSRNEISSIQSLYYLRTPSLKKLNLTDNHLISIKPLRKSLHFSSLQSLSTWGNHLLAIASLCQIKSIQLNQICLDYYDDNYVCSCLPFAKLQTKKLQKIVILAKKRIVQTHSWGRLSNKFLNKQTPIEIYHQGDDQDN